MRILHFAAAIARAILLILFCAFVSPVLKSQSQPPPPKIPGNFLDVGGAKIYYEECGRGRKPSS